MRRRRQRGEGTGQRGLYVRLVILALIVAYATAFIIENATATKVRFVFADAHVSLVWLMLLCLVIGVAWGLALPGLYRRSRRRRQERAQARDAVPDLGRADEAEGQAGAAPAAVAGEEVGALDEGDTRRLGPGEEIGRVD